MQKECLECKKVFYRPLRISYKSFTERKYCSHECSTRLGGIKLSKRVILKCKMCDKDFEVRPYQERQGRIYCSQQCYGKGITGKNSSRYNQIIKNCKYCNEEFQTWPSKAKYNTGIYCSRKCKSEFCSKFMVGENATVWKGGIENHKREDKRNDPAYQKWVILVKRRDKECRLKNKNCFGYKIVHHILSWREYSELRYKINNGITLCQAHHPLRRAEEKRLISKFQGLVSVSKALI